MSDLPLAALLGEHGIAHLHDETLLGL